MKFKWFCCLNSSPWLPWTGKRFYQWLSWEGISVNRRLGLDYLGWHYKEGGELTRVSESCKSAFSSGRSRRLVKGRGIRRATPLLENVS